MSNVIFFPACIRIKGWWWHAGKKYRDVLVLKDSISEREYERVYQFDLRQVLREELVKSKQQGGAA